MKTAASISTGRPSTICFGVAIPPRNPGCIFVHGNGAHAHWWTFIAPFFLDDYRVASIDLAGAGDSGYSETYTPEGFAAQLVGVADDAGFGNDTIIVGHSFGGYLTLKAGLLYRDKLTGIVLVAFGGPATGLCLGARPQTFADQTKTSLSRLRVGVGALSPDAAAGLQQ
ncbi:MAG: alpha/beta hydrolase [Gammaproteobacteria bacterium]|nr:alpha/beta hydrolase [Gammaproteobacteria bacterium]